MTEQSNPMGALRAKSNEAAELLRQLSNPTRLMILCHIAEQERSVGEMEQALELKQPGLSQQLAELRQAGLVKTRRQSRSVYYSIADTRTKAILDMLWQTFCNPSAATPKSKSLASESSQLPPEAAHFARAGF